MATREDQPAAATPAHDETACMPCHGSGQVISNLGGEANSVPCPWCGGSGVRQQGVDAQARWIAEGASPGDGAAHAEDDAID